MEKMKMHSMNKIDENVKKIATLFPECITETLMPNSDGGYKLTKVVDFDILRQIFSKTAIEGNKERYQFTWPDKRKARAIVNQEVNSALRPCREESVNFDTTENLYIEGDNLEVLKLLQETYLGKIKMIYIDPPYNTGHDFVYEDDFSQKATEYSSNSGQYDDQGNCLVENTESNGRFHTNWLNMMYPRLLLAKDLLSEDGVLFISIDDHELNNALSLCSEIFENQNIIVTLPRVTKKAGKTTDCIAQNHDYVIVISKQYNKLKIYLPSHTDDGFKYADEFEANRGKYKLNQTLDYDSLQYSESLDYPIIINGETLYPGGSYKRYLERKAGNHARADWAWRWSKELFEFGLCNNFIVLKKYNGYSRIYTKTYQNCTIEKNGKEFKIIYIDRTRPISSLEFVDNKYSNDNSKKNITNLFGENIFDYSKPVSLLKSLISFSTRDKDIILDFFSGSATTAHAVMKLNAEDGGHRKFIMVQLPEKCDEKSEAYKAGYKNICEIGKERIRRAGKQILEEMKNKNGDLFAEETSLDIGFRDLKLDSSNMKDVYYTPDSLDKDMLDGLISNIKEDRTPEDLLFQVMLDLGILLSAKITEEEIDGKKVFNVDDNYLIACFDNDVDENVIIEIAKKKPTYFVMRDSSLANDSVSVNFDQFFARYSPDTVRKVL